MPSPALILRALIRQYLPNSGPSYGSLPDPIVGVTGVPA